MLLDTGHHKKETGIVLTVRFLLLSIRRGLSSPSSLISQRNGNKAGRPLVAIRRDL